MARQDRLAIAFISLAELVTMSSMCLKTRASLTSRLSWALAGAVDSGGAVDGDALPFVVFTAFIVFIEVFLLALSFVVFISFIVFIEVFLLFVSMGAFRCHRNQSNECTMSDLLEK